MDVHPMTSSNKERQFKQKISNDFLLANRWFVTRNSRRNKRNRTNGKNSAAGIPGIECLEKAMVDEATLPIDDAISWTVQGE